MATTFNVFYLGVLPDMDTFEGNSNAENAGALVGMRFGSQSDPLRDHVHTMSPGSTGYAGGATRDSYDSNSRNDTWRIDGGSDHLHDMAMNYVATITYLDGSTATVTAVLVQDTAGHTYWVPEREPNSDQAAMDAGQIRSLQLNSAQYSSIFNGGWNLAADRNVGAPVTCFTPGTRIRTRRGMVPVTRLKPGDACLTLDNGWQRLRWVGKRRFCARELRDAPALLPVQIEEGAFGNEKPMRVSQQHAFYVSSYEGGQLIRAKHAATMRGGRGVRMVPRPRGVTYIHLLFDEHQIIDADGAWSESFYPGPEALAGLPDHLRASLLHVLPDVANYGPPARPYLTRWNLRELACAA
ncbi:Hint domain-containing protein [Maritimibacter sp. DP1N21-5]|uniref:Hint domain-containing protein n=1 Tax=Maritimibacter sp. DP1N21-5 TaxID=2836867 RepID=UPI001C4749D6|nr:Hint domain-containing protein [Maritimibacter sp. DP1N21-5]MBV7409414.1 Hint domain-containing protein [Maritimibacter sp. DP1N21-5]